ncbi:hypothetical protein Goarm_002126, partial [Gossypium armourianum]|nr:hypothetical protein [Gossypium armourianum]
MVKWLMITWIFALIFSNVVQASNRLSVGFEPPKYVTITGDVATMIVIQLAVIVTLRDSHRCAPIAAKKR